MLCRLFWKVVYMINVKKIIALIISFSNQFIYQIDRITYNIQFIKASVC